MPCPVLQGLRVVTTGLEFLSDSEPKALPCAQGTEQWKWLHQLLCSERCTTALQCFISSHLLLAFEVSSCPHLGGYSSYQISKTVFFSSAHRKASIEIVSKGGLGSHRNWHFPNQHSVFRNEIQHVNYYHWKLVLLLFIHSVVQRAFVYLFFFECLFRY